MNWRQALFILEYLVDLDGAAAAIRAGYSCGHARRQAARLLADAEIGAAIRGAMAERARRTGITRQRVIEEYARVAFAEMGLIENVALAGLALAEALAAPENEGLAAARLVAFDAAIGESLDSDAGEERKALQCLARVLGLNLVAPALGALPQA